MSDDNLDDPNVKVNLDPFIHPLRLEQRGYSYRLIFFMSNYAEALLLNIALHCRFLWSMVTLCENYMRLIAGYSRTLII